MDPDWDEVSRIAFPAPLPANTNPLQVEYPLPASALAFDTCAELLWAGDHRGRVVSFYTRELQRYTAFKIQTNPSDGAVRQFLFHDKGVIALGSKCVHMAMRKGPAMWNIQHEDMKDLRCMSFTSKGASEIIVAGWQSTMFVIDVNKGEIVKQLQTEHYYSIMKKSRNNICAATNKGCVNLLDPVSFKVVRGWQAHATCINDMDAKGDFIVTCGGHNKHQSASVTLDSYVNVYDLRNMASMKPIPFPPLAAYVRVHPRMLTTTIVTSQHGQMHVVDIMNPTTSNVRYANITSYIALFDVAPSARALAIADDSAIHLWGSPNDTIHFTDMAPPLALPDPEEPPPPIDWSPDKPLSLIGMPFYRDTLFSAWPVDIISDMSAPPMSFDTSYLATLVQRDWGYYGQNSKKLRRNYIEDSRSKTPSTTRPKFLSEKARESVMAPGQGHAEDGGYDSVSGGSLDSSSPHKLPSLEDKPPPMYSLLEIMYSKFGVDDFDFGYYNKTNYSGLQNQIPNSYANALLQLMHYTPLLRNMALQHTATACQAELCLLCEMGFVFDMLQKAEGVAVHATNMFRAIAADDGAQKLSLVEPDDRPRSMSGQSRQIQPQVPNVLIQGLARLLMDRVGQDYRSTRPISTRLEEELFKLQSPANLDELVQKVLSTEVTSNITCLNCRTDTTRFGAVQINDLIYPAQKSSASQPSGPVPLRGQGSNSNNKGPKTTFSQILKMGVERDNTGKGWCARCRRYQNLALRKTIHNIPAVLTINTSIMSAEHRKLWETPNFLPEEIGVIVKDGQFFCFEGDDLRTHLMRGAHNITVYSLIGMVVNIEHKPPGRPHLVGIVNVAHSESSAEEARWHLFNDFAVRRIATEEALRFNADWKMPSVIMYQVKKGCGRGQDDSWRKGLDTSILYKDFSRYHSGGGGNGGGGEKEKSYEILDPETEGPGPGTVFAIDTEYVSLKQEELLVTSQGEKETIRPAWLALGRVSLVRAGGEREGEAFVDDWINIREEVVDYLTPFSGIRPEDLDPRTCGKARSLVPLKVAYKRLWVLLNLGCKFLGHGLRADFRVINIHVPKGQVIDTSVLFHLKERLRWLGLALLADIVFGIKIQKGGKGHDSIEDARMSLKLYRKWEEWEDAGILNGELVRIYNEGRKRQFKASREDDGVGGVPGAAGAAGAASSAAIVQAISTPVRIGTPTTMLVEGMGGMGLGLGVGAGTPAVAFHSGVPTTPVREYPPATATTGTGTAPATGLGSRAAPNGSPLPRG